MNKKLLSAINYYGLIAYMFIASIEYTIMTGFIRKIFENESTYLPVILSLLIVSFFISWGAGSLIGIIKNTPIFKGFIASLLINIYILFSFYFLEPWLLLLIVIGNILFATAGTQFLSEPINNNTPFKFVFFHFSVAPFLKIPFLMLLIFLIKCVIPS